MKALIDIISAHKNGEPIGIYSVCSAHPLVLEAALMQGRKDDSYVLIEATSNQVNQFGGYTGMQPAGFSEMVYELANKVGVPKEKVLLGGDHLGPNCWQSLNADDAMNHADDLIASYIKAGFTKIHLDCSMPCKGDPKVLSDEVVAERAARLCKIAEQYCSDIEEEKPVYIIGTEVPVPGGATESLSDDLQITIPDDAQTTISKHKAAFELAGLNQTWRRVVALVVQPGVEFDHHKVVRYQSDKAQALSKVIEESQTMVYEAHSTDYQSPEAYKQLVKDHFAILKVGPALTFSLREALFSLDSVEREWLGEENATNLRKVVEIAMKEKPKYWSAYYDVASEIQSLDIVYSLSDRVRYYWPDPVVKGAVDRLLLNLSNKPAPMTILSQYLPEQMKAIVCGDIENDPQQIIMNKIMEVTESYSQACR